MTKVKPKKKTVKKKSNLTRRRMPAHMVWECKCLCNNCGDVCWIQGKLKQSLRTIQCPVCGMCKLVVFSINVANKLTEPKKVKENEH